MTQKCSKAVCEWFKNDSKALVRISIVSLISILVGCFKKIIQNAVVLKNSNHSFFNKLHYSIPFYMNHLK